MEYAKDEIFQIRYNTELNRLQMKGEKWTSKFYKKIVRHKFLFTIIATLIIFSTINIIMIKSFMQILCNFSIGIL